MVPPSVEISGLQNHVESFHAKGAAELRRTEESENTNKSEKATDATDIKNSEKLASVFEEHLEDDETGKMMQRMVKQEIMIWKRMMMMMQRTMIRKTTAR